MQVRQAGQAFRLGRYPVHLHMNGEMPDTYMKGCAIHHTYNRAMTMHGTNSTLIQRNVAFDSMGHQFFIEDGSESKEHVRWQSGHPGAPEPRAAVDRRHASQLLAHEPQQHCHQQCGCRVHSGIRILVQV